MIKKTALSAVVCLSFLFVAAQDNAPVYTELVYAENLQDDLADDDMVLVDLHSQAKVYPTMEEEMAMYVSLRSSTPRAFFFPNPSGGIVWVEHNFGKGTEVRIKSVEGNILFKAKDLQAKKLDLKAFAPGDYIIEVVNGDKSCSKRLRVLPA